MGVPRWSLCTSSWSLWADPNGTGDQATKRTDQATQANNQYPNKWPSKYANWGMTKLPGITDQRKHGHLELAELVDGLQLFLFLFGFSQLGHRVLRHTPAIHLALSAKQYKPFLPFHLQARQKHSPPLNGKYHLNTDSVVISVISKIYWSSLKAASKKELPPSTRPPDVRPTSPLYDGKRMRNGVACFKARLQLAQTFTASWKTFFSMAELKAWKLAREQVFFLIMLIQLVFKRKKCFHHLNIFEHFIRKVWSVFIVFSNVPLLLPSKVHSPE